ncbi:hypothetical protein Q9L58_009616, partial [Maublancomyces gigas]
MTAERNLVIGEVEKLVLTATCFVRLIEGLWKWNNYSPSRAASQYLLNMKLMAYTTSRPGALVASHCYKGEALLYKDVRLSLVEYQPGERVFGLEMRIERAKGRRTSNELITFLLHEIRENSIICPIFDFITIAFLDRAFEDVKSPEELYQLRVPHSSDTLQIPFRTDILDMPICRDANGESLTFNSLDYMIKQAGRCAGFRASPSCYWLRRGTANALDGNATPSELKFIMGHRSIAIFDKHYLNRKIQYDTQSAFLQTSSETETFEILNRVEMNRGAPQKLSSALRSALWENPVLEELIRKRDEIKEKIKEQGMEHQNDPIFAAAYNAVHAMKAYLRRKAFEDERAEFFWTASSKEICSQIDSGGREQTQYSEAPPVYRPDQHKQVMEAILSSSHPEYPRHEIIQDLVQFCDSDPKAGRCNPTINPVAPLTDSTAIDPVLLALPTYSMALPTDSTAIDPILLALPTPTIDFVVTTGNPEIPGSDAVELKCPKSL